MALSEEQKVRSEAMDRAAEILRKSRTTSKGLVMSDINPPITPEELQGMANFILDRWPMTATQAQADFMITTDEVVDDSQEALKFAQSQLDEANHWKRAMAKDVDDARERLAEAEEKLQRVRALVEQKKYQNGSTLVSSDLIRNALND